MSPVYIFEGVFIRTITRGHFVYVWKRGDSVLYVGRSKQGILRLKSHHHISDLEIEDTDVFEYYECKDWESVVKKESELIEKLNPILNQKVGRPEGVTNKTPAERAEIEKNRKIQKEIDKIAKFIRKRNNG